MKVTIKDIAREANVSASTVSLVLNNKPCRVAKETRELIFSIAKKKNYRVNQAARSLITKETKIIGMIIPDIENIFFSSLSKNIEEYCRQQGYMLIIVSSDDKEEMDLQLLDMLNSRGVDALFVTPSNESLLQGSRMMQSLQNLRIPYVLVDRYFEELPSNRVYFDNEEGAFLAVKHLVEMGHTKIGCIASGTQSKNGYARISGYQHAMDHFELEYDLRWIHNGNYRFEGGYAAAKEVLKTEVSAVFICNDMMTLGFMRCMHELGKEIPKDISVVSYDNTMSHFLPGGEVSAVEQDVKQLALSACELLFRSLKEEVFNQVVCLHPQLIKKASVKKIG